jgi:hypothetical protein
MAIRYLSGVNIDSNTLVVDDVNNRVGIGTASPTVALHIVTGGSTQIRLQHDSWNYWDITSAYNITNADLYFSMAGAEKFRINASGNVGIGTTSPTEKLSLSGSTATTFGLSLEPSGWNSAKHRFTVPVSGDTSMWSFNYNGSVVDSSLYATSSIQIGQGAILFSTGGTNTAPSEKMRVTSSGNVGIANSSPITKFTVGAYEGSRLPYINGTANTFNADGITVTSYNTANAGIGGGLDLTNNVYSVGSFSPLISFSSKTQSGTYNNNYAAIYGILAGDSGDGNWNSGHLVFATALAYGASEKMRITNAGNVGIGTTSPSSKLHVSSSGETTLIIDSTSAGTARINLTGAGGGAGAITSTVGGLYVYASGANPITFNTNGSERLRVESNGNVGIGTTSPFTKLHVAGGSDYNTTFSSDSNRAGWVINGPGTATPRASALVISSDSSFRLGTLSYYHIVMNTDGSTQIYDSGGGAATTFAATGNVGIGTTAPYEKLDIVGNIRLGNYTDAGTKYIGYANNTFANQFIAGMSIESTALGGNYSQRLNFATHYYGVYAGVRMTLDEQGRLGIGTTTPKQKLIVEGTLATKPGGVDGYYSYLRSNWAQDNAFELGISEDGANTFHKLITSSDYYFGSTLQFWTSDTEKMRITSAGNVGIGTTSPASVSNYIAQTINGTDGSFTEYRQNGTALFRIGADGSRPFLYGMTAAPMDFYTNTNLWMRIASGGNVLIGTTIDYTKLTVSNGAATRSGITISDTTSASLMMFAGASAPASISFDTFGLRFVGGSTVGTDNGSEFMRITTAGNVGIGTTNPNNTLEVAGSLGSGKSTIRITNTDTGNYATIIAGLPGTTNAGMSFATDGTSKMVIDASGEVGIGTVLPMGPLEVYKANTGGLGGHIILNNNGMAVGNETAVLFNDSGVGSVSSVRAAISSSVEGSPYYGDLKFKTGATSYGSLNTRMIITGAGNVGIGTTSPSSKLHVSGDSYVTGQFAQGVAVGSKIAAYGAEFRSSSASAQIFFGRSGDSIGSGGIGADETSTFIVWSIPSFVKLLVVNQNGNVGINTDAPSQKLHVVGNARVTGAYYDSNNEAGLSGQVLSSTASGTNWVSLSEITGVDGTGTANYVAKWSDTDTITNSSITDNGTTVTATVDRLNMNKQAGIYVFSKTVGTSTTSDFFSISNSHGAQAFRVTFVCSTSGYSVAKTYEVVHGFGGSPVYNKIVDTGAYSGNDFDVVFADSNGSAGTKATVTNNSTTNSGNIVATVFLGGGSETITVTAL